MREEDAAAFEYFAAFDHARQASATFRSRPFVAPERLDTQRFQPSTIRACRSRKYARVATVSTVSFARGERAITDVLAELHAGKTDVGNRGVGRTLRLPHRIGQRGHA